MMDLAAPSLLQAAVAMAEVVQGGRKPTHPPVIPALLREERVAAQRILTFFPAVYYTLISHSSGFGDQGTVTGYRGSHHRKVAADAIYTIRTVLYRSDSLDGVLANPPVDRSGVAGRPRSIHLDQSVSWSARMALDRRNLPAIREGELGTSATIPHLDISGVRRLIDAARTAPQTGRETHC